MIVSLERDVLHHVTVPIQYHEGPLVAVAHIKHLIEMNFCGVDSGRNGTTMAEAAFPTSLDAEFVELFHIVDSDLKEAELVTETDEYLEAVRMAREGEKVVVRIRFDEFTLEFDVVPAPNRMVDTACDHQRLVQSAVHPRDGTCVVPG